ncbi:MAG: ABC transporter ATP-binding protein [Victivallales bacterium]|nr:ABC transporter ATP-binding protein [Victivallales bacterium]
MAIFWRLFHQYALRHWFRLFLGLFFALLMGGAMHGFLRFLDIGVMTLELGGSSDKTKTEQVQDGAEHKHENPIQKVLKNRLLQWTIQKLGIQQTLEKKEKHAKAEGEPTPDSESKDVSKFEKKVSKLTGKLGLEMNGSETLTLPVVCVIVVLLMFFFMIKAVSEFINKYFLRWVGARVVTDMREDLFRNFQQQSLRFFSQNDVGQLISRCTNDTALVDHAFSNSIAEMVLAPIQIIVALDFILRKALEVGLVKPTLLMCLVAPFCLVPVYVVSKYIRTYQHKVLRRIALLVAAMQENLNGIRVVKAFNREEFENERFRKQNNHYFRAVVKAVLADVFMGPTMQLTAIGIGIVFIILCYHYQISLGVLFSLGYAAQTAYRPLKELAKMNTNLQKCAAAAERIFNMLDVSSHLPEPENPEPKTAFNDSIRFENVTFAYEKEQGNVLQNFSLEIKKGQHVAIVGATGSGKSTTANLLARFYDPDQGSITIDGRDLRSISNHDLRSLIGIVAQDNFLFNETIAYNILYGRPEASEEELHDAAQRANAADFIEADPLGYNRPCGERGCLLSGGQKQRIAIARALLKNPPILILDEATSALDTITEQLVQQAIDQLKQDRTVLSIAHRLSTIVHSDNIVVLENGHIVEQGTHQELYALNGKYKDLYDRQVSGNDPLP